MGKQKNTSTTTRFKKLYYRYQNMCLNSDYLGFVRNCRKEYNFAIRSRGALVLFQHLQQQLTNNICFKQLIFRNN